MSESQDLDIIILLLYNIYFIYIYSKQAPLNKPFCLVSKPRSLPKLPLLPSGPTLVCAIYFTQGYSIVAIKRRG